MPSLSYASHHHVHHQSRKSHRLLNLRNRLPRIQPLRTRPRAIQNGMTSVQTHTVVQRLHPFGFMLIAAVCQPAVGLQQDGGTEVFFTVPPVGGAGGGAAGAEDAFVEAVELLAVGGGLAVFETLKEITSVYIGNVQ